ncbi:MAG: phosphotyrosine protein phosphatase [Fibrobacteria bacterium]|nr:phosphotyrosine protein phosphatase [Fibrobacteria bacterium]
MNLLFVCSRNRLRSPTAEIVFAGRPGWRTASAGLAPDAESPLDADAVDWADVVLVMEKRHRKVLQERFSRSLRNKRVVCLDIPDDFEFMDPELVRILQERVPKALGSMGSPES